MKGTLGHEVAESLFGSLKSFVVLGLCGRTGSGCSTVAQILGQNFEQLDLPTPPEELDGSIQASEWLTLYHYAQKNWVPFYQIKVSRLMTGYLLNETPDTFMKYIKEMFPQLLPESYHEIQTAVNEFYGAEMAFELPDYFIQHMIADHPANWKELLSGLGGFLTEDDAWGSLFPKNHDQTEKEDEFNRNVSAQISKEPPFRIPGKAGKKEIPYRYEYDPDKNSCIFYIKISDMQALLDTYETLRKSGEPLGCELLYWMLYRYAYQALPQYADKLWSDIKQIQRGLPTLIMQAIGINLRTWGKPLVYSAEEQKLSFQKEGFLTIIKRVNLYLKILRDYLQKQGEYADSVKEIIEEKIRSSGNAPVGYTESLVLLNSETRQVVVVIDSIKNPFESMYLKARYSSYYLTAIYTDEAERRERLESPRKGLTLKEIKAIDTIEQLDKFKEFMGGHSRDWPGQKIKDESTMLTKDSLKSISKNLRSEEMAGVLPFIMQNVEHCVETADIFINNSRDNNQYLQLKKKLVRYVSLIMNPGLVLPTDVERCMQIAQTAKVNSGCISRQVGAVLTDSLYRVRSIGWNDVAHGRVPCTYRDMMEVRQHWNLKAYSNFENDDNDDFQEQIRNDDRIPDACQLIQMKGKRIPYCFKDVYNGIKKNKNQVHPRSLHAEERAFLSLADQGGASIAGGYLFTTSSPCELCTKKVCYMGISKVYYIEPYSGISSKHVMSDGPQGERPVQELFTGAIGRAYTYLYTPILPKKDELELWLGFKLDGDNRRQIPQKVKGKAGEIGEKPGADLLETGPENAMQDDRQTAPLTGSLEKPDVQRQREVETCQKKISGHERRWRGWRGK